MATILENQATVSYLYDGITDTLDATSNVASTTLTDACSAVVTKTPLSGTFRNGDNVSYIVRVENTGSAALSGVTITDDLANGALSYVANSLNVYVDSDEVAITPTSTTPTLEFGLPTNLPSGSVIIVVYTARVNSTADSVANTATVTGTGVNPSQCNVTESVTSTITAANFAELSIFKNSSADTITSGDELTYTFTIMNTGNSPATDVVLTDDLPNEFEIGTITVTTDGTSRTYTTTEYDVDTATNTITLPNGAGEEINVPKATAQGPGITTVTITGTVI